MSAVDAARTAWSKQLDSLSYASKTKSSYRRHLTVLLENVARAQRVQVVDLTWEHLSPRAIAGAVEAYRLDGFGSRGAQELMTHRTPLRHFTDWARENGYAEAPRVPLRADVARPSLDESRALLEALGGLPLVQRVRELTRAGKTAKEAAVVAVAESRELVEQ